MRCSFHACFLPTGQTKKVFELAAEQVNKQCPITVDEMTRMDSTTYSGKDNTFTYFYTLSYQADDPTMSEQLKKSLEETLPETIKNTEEMKVYRESDVTIKYIYLSGKNKGRADSSNSYSRYV